MKVFLESKALLQTVADEAARNDDVAKQLVAGLSDSQLNWKPTAERWSIAQCLDHLAISSAGYNELYAEAIERGKRKWPIQGSVAYRPSLIGGWLIKQLLPETTRKLPAPGIFKPPDSSAIHGTLEKFLNQQSALLSFVSKARGLDYNKTRLRSPVTALIRYSVADAFVINVVHAWRHLAQARRVREEPAFPTS